MSPRLLQITYSFRGSRVEFEEGFGPVAAQIAEVTGMRWKIWLMDEANSRGGGTYVFEDEHSMQAYLEGPIIAGLKAHPAFSDVRVQSFAILDGPTTVTRGPIK